MKKYLFASLAAIFAILTSCSDDKYEPTTLDDLQVSASTVAINPNGGSKEITVTSNQDWTLNYNVENSTDSLDDQKGKVTYNELVDQLSLEANTWFKVSQTSGKAGTTKITFTADSTSSTRSSDICIKVGDKYQHIIVEQVVTAEKPVVSVKDVVNGTDNVTYRVKGTCSAIANTTYGNFYMTDSEGNSVYVYGTVDDAGSYNWSKFNIAIGDEVTVEGPRATYNGTVELVDATFIKVTKALLKCDTEMTIGKEAKDFTISATQNGTGLTFQSNTEWLTFTTNGYTVDSNGNYVFTISPEENTTGAERTGSVTITSTKGSQTSPVTITITQLGTDAVNATVAQLSDSVTSGKKYYDVILKNAKVTYKNGSNYFIEDETGGILLYSSSVSLAVGSTISGRVCGKATVYNNLPELTSMNTSLATVTTSVKTPEPTVVTLAELAANYNKYVSRYIIIKDATVAKDINVTYSKVTSAGSITDGTNTFSLNCQSTGKYNGNKIYFYSQHAAGDKVTVTCIPTVYKTNQQLNVYAESWIK